MNMSMIDLTPVFQAIIALLAALVTYRLIPWIQSKTNKNQQEALITAARIAVLAAEQIIGSGHGQQKFDYALSVLKAAGFKIDGSLAIAAVEKAVRDLKLFDIDAAIDQDDLKTQEAPEDVKTVFTIKTTPAVVGSDYITTAGSPTVTAENTVTAADHADATTQTITPAPEAHPPEPSENE